MKGRKDTIFVVVLALLIVFSVFQTFEISELESSGVVSSGASVKSPEKSSVSGGYNLPDNLGDLKNMVGGC